jgi:hypothetical protein
MPEAVELEVHGEVLKVSRYLPDDLIQRIDAAEVLGTLGIPVNYNQLCQWATRRVGPPYIRRGRVALYRYADLVAWAKERLALYPRRIAP